MRTRYRFDVTTQTWVEADKIESRSAHVHAVHQDTCAPMLHPVSGKVYDSVSAFRRATKEAGCVEVGNDWVNHRQRPQVKPTRYKEAIAEALRQHGRR